MGCAAAVIDPARNLEVCNAKRRVPAVYRREQVRQRVAECALLMTATGLGEERGTRSRKTSPLELTLASQATIGALRQH